MAQWGAEARYVDALGAVHRCDPDTVAAVRALVGPPPDPDEGPLVVGPSDVLPAGTLLTEDGDEIPSGRRGGEPLPLGYHRLFTTGTRPTGHDGDGGRPVIVSPRRCAAGDDRWGWAVQLYAARSAASWGIGDLGDLAALGRWSRSVGAGYLMINPLGASAGDRQEPSPYYPATRRFLHPLYLRVDDVPLAERAGPALDAARAAGTALNARPLIERDAAWRTKREALEAIWAAGPPPADFERWLAAASPSLERFAVWSAIADRHGAAFGDWPSGLRHPDGPAVADFAARHDDRVRFHAWLQWATRLQLDAAAAEMELVPDLAVGFDPTGFDAWDWQDLLALDVSIGAPPDAFNPAGQRWGLPPFVPSLLHRADYQPFAETLRSLMVGATGLRIDHILGLFRQWWIPGDNGPGDGCYVRFPADELLAVLALESHRHDVAIVGEDLGTVEKGVRAALAAHDVLSYRVLWFEDVAPRRWPEATAAAITTHDLPTVAGVWTGADVDGQRAAGQVGDEASITEFRDRLCTVAGLDGDEELPDAVVAAHRALAAAPSRLRTVALEDAVGTVDRPNMPGTTVATNWSRPLPVTIEDLGDHPLVTRVATAMSGKDDGLAT